MSKSLEAYQQRTRTVSALERYEVAGMGRHPGQDVRYVVVDDEKNSRERVRLPFEAYAYDPEFYVDLLFRAAESVLSPVEWDREDNKRYLRDSRDTRLSTYTR